MWWYGQGLKDFLYFFRKQIKNVWHNRGLDVLIKNWFKPMYGQNDLQGRIISLFFRTRPVPVKFYLDELKSAHNNTCN
jgi:hypothetical protein